MDTDKLGVMEWLNKDEVQCSDEYAMELLYEGVLKLLNKNNNDDFGTDFILLHPLGYLH